MNEIAVQAHQRVDPVAQGFWHLPADVWTAVGTCVAGAAAVVALLVAVFVGLRQLDEARRLRREQAQPYVAVFIEETGTGIHQYNLAVKNFGTTAAKDVRVSITPPPRSANLRNSDVEAWLTVPDVIPILVPGQQWDTYWDWSGALDEAKDLPRRYDAAVSFNDSRGTHVETYHFVLDWETLITRGAATRYGVHHVASALQDIVLAVNRVTTGGGSITVERFDRDHERKKVRRARRRRERRFRVAGNSQDPASPFDRVAVEVEKMVNRLRST